jgi:hypothetical protein
VPIVVDNCADVNPITPLKFSPVMFAPVKFPFIITEFVKLHTNPIVPLLDNHLPNTILPFTDLLQPLPPLLLPSPLPPFKILPLRQIEL